MPAVCEVYLLLELGRFYGELVRDENNIFIQIIYYPNLQKIDQNIIYRHLSYHYQACPNAFTQTRCNNAPG